MAEQDAIKFQMKCTECGAPQTLILTEKDLKTRDVYKSLLEDETLLMHCYTCVRSQTFKVVGKDACHLEE